MWKVFIQILLNVNLFPWIKLSRHSCSMWGKLGWLDWFWQFLCEGLSSVNMEGFSFSYAWSRSLCEGRISFTWDVSLEKFADSFLCFQLALYYSASYFFFLYWVPSLSLCKFLMLFLGLSINSYDNVFVFEDFDIHHKNKLTYWRWIDRPGELGWNWCIYPSS